MSNQFCKFDDMINDGADLFRLSETRLNIQTNTMNNLNGFEKFLSIQKPAVPKLNRQLRRISKENHPF